MTRDGMMQGRARPSLAELYRWRYEGLGDLPNVLTGPEYLRANPGFAFDYQFIDVPDYQGRGESTPVPYFYQVPSYDLVSLLPPNPCHTSVHPAVHVQVGRECEDESARW